MCTVKIIQTKHDTKPHEAWQKHAISLKVFLNSWPLCGRSAFLVSNCINNPFLWSVECSRGSNVSWGDTHAVFSWRNLEYTCSMFPAGTNTFKTCSNDKMNTHKYTRIMFSGDTSTLNMCSAYEMQNTNKACLRQVYCCISAVFHWNVEYTKYMSPGETVVFKLCLTVEK